MKTTVITGYIMAVICFCSSASNACTHNVYAYVGSVSPSYYIQTGQSVTVTRSTSSYCDVCTISYYSWSAPGGSQTSGDGTSFTCSYSTTGQKTITLKAHCAAGTIGSKSITITVVKAPVVENRLPEVDENNGVVLKGEVTDPGWPAPNVKFYYDTLDHGTSSWPNQIGPDPAGTKTGDFSSVKISNMAEGKTYYFRTYAWNEYGGSDWDDHTTHSISNPIKFRTAPGWAKTPTPANLADFDSTSVTLQWQAGTSPEATPEHRIYFGPSYDDVYSANTTTSEIYKTQQTGTSHTISETLVRGQRYYWRIDEVIQDTHNNVSRVRKGQIWSFIVSTIIDDDNDDMDDQWELLHNVTDPTADPDNDGLTNLQEFQHSTDPNDDDTDDDGITDGDELDIATGSTFLTDPLNSDTDGDGIVDGWEVDYGLNPTINDTDTILFGIPAWWWYEQDIEPSQAYADADLDEDGLINSAEFAAGTNPHVADTDGDGIDDWWENAYSNYFYIADVQEALDPTKYDAYDKVVGGIPASWWYTWWTYCYESTDPAVHDKYTYFQPTTVNAAEDTNLDSDGFTNLVEYQNGTSPLVGSADDYWTEYVYDEAGNVVSEKQYVYEIGTTTEKCIAETTNDYDELSRRWRTRQLAEPGTIDNSKDSITLTKYYVDSSVQETIQKGYYGTNSNLDDDAYEMGDVVVSYTYDRHGRQETVIDASDEVTTYNYNPSTGLLESIDLPAKSGTRTMTYHYDNAGRVKATVNPQGNYEVSTYDSMGHVVNSILYETIGAMDYPNTIVDDLPVTQRRMEYDNLGTMVKNIVMADASNTGAYNPAVDRVTENLIDYSSINKTVNSIIYSDAGEIVDSTWSYTDVEDDATGRGLVTEIWKGTVLGDSSQPMVKQYVNYNAAGQVTAKFTDHFDHFVDREGQDQPNVSTLSKMQYDTYGRLVATVVDPDGDPQSTTDDLVTHYGYWGRWKISETDPENNITGFEYDAFGHIKKKTEDAGQGGLARITEYEYDRLGNLKKLVADDDNTTPLTVQETHYTYSLSGNVTQITYPDTGTIAYVYDDPAAGGRPTARTDQSNVTTVYAYDKLGNLLQKQNDPANPTIVETYTYDARGLMKSAYKGTSDTPPYNKNISAADFYYSGLGYLDHTTQKIGTGSERTIAYERNQIGKPTKITYPDAPLTAYFYNYTSLGQVDTISRSGTQLVDYSYAGTSIMGRSYPVVGVNNTTLYDDYGRVKRLTTVNGSGDGVDFRYTYDNNGNITQQEYLHRPSQPVANGFTYDDLNRLYTATYQAGTAGTETFNYDLLGNRDSVVDSRSGGTTDTYGDNNAVNEYSTIQIGSGPAVQVFYDNNGNLTTDHRGYSYVYDYENKIVQIYKDLNTNGVYDGTDINIAEYSYDALGRRIEKTNPAYGTAERYYYDDQRIVLRTSVDSGGVESDSRTFVFGNYIDEVLIMRLPSGSDFYYAHDHLYSPTVLYGNTGSIVLRYEYDAYGKRDQYTAAWVPSSIQIFGNPFAFTGRELDYLDGGNLNLMHYRARTYDPETGRFMQRDPVGYRDSLNLFEYVISRPTMLKDPHGMFYTITECPDSSLNTICITKAGEPADRKSEFMECGKTEKFLIAVLGAEFAIELKIPGTIAGIAYSTCCKCEEKFTWIEVPVREWKGKIMVNHGFFGIGQNKIVAVDFEGLGPIQRKAVNIKRHFYINCNGKRIPIGSEDWSFMTPDPSDFWEYPTESFNADAFESPWIIWF